MRKEVVLAIIAGVVLGVVVAFGVWRANSALKPKGEESKNVAQSENKNVSSPSKLSLTIAKPGNNEVITEIPIVVSGITKPFSWVTISGQEEDYIVSSDASGNFEENIDLSAGVNQIIVKVFDEQGNSFEQNLIVVYSKEFAKDAYESTGQ